MDRGSPKQLPRTRSSFADEFFQTDPFRNFESHGTLPNRFGSNSRIFNEDLFMDNFDRPFNDEPSFFRSSLPRRTFQSSDSPFSTPYGQSPPASQHKESTAPPPFQHHRSKSHYDDSANWDDGRTTHGQWGAAPSQQHPNDPNVHVIKIRQEAPSQPQKAGRAGSGQFVEINNAFPNYGTVNPDKRRRFSKQNDQDHAGGNRASSIPNITIDDYGDGPTSDRQASPPVLPTIIPLPAPAIPLPPPPEKKQQVEEMAENGPNTKIDDKIEVGEENVAEEREGNRDGKEESEENNKGQLKSEEFSPIAESGEGLVHLLDGVEIRVETLREEAAKLEQEKEAILEQMGQIKRTARVLARISQGERDELELSMDRVLLRCSSVHVNVNTPRDERQILAVERVNKLIDSALGSMQAADLIGTTRAKIQSMYNACRSEEVEGHVDEKFQSAIIEATADDQKKIRRKLAQILEQMPKDQ